MKLVGLMLVRNDEWILDLSARVALRWCDAVVFLDNGSGDRSREILSKLSAEYGTRVSVIFVSFAPDTPNSDYMESMLERARREGATHIATLSPNELLSSNLFEIKKTITKVPDGNMVFLPLVYCWKNAYYYRNDTSIWSNANTPLAFKDHHGVHWKGVFDSERFPRGLHWNPVHPVTRGAGAIVNLEHVNWRKARAKHYLLEMKEVLRRPLWKEKKKPQNVHLLDEGGMKLSRVPDEWYSEYKEVIELLAADGRSHYEEDVALLFAEHGQEMFYEIRSPGEVLGVAEKIIPPMLLNVEPRKPKAVNVKSDPSTNGKEERPFSRHLVFWSGHFLDYSGYGKANREFLFRAANSLNIALDPGELSSEPIFVDDLTKARVMAHASNLKFEGAPYLRFFGPREELHRGHRICFTMMETYGAHQSLVSLLNRYYDEVWVPTSWNKSVFEGSGVNIPVRTIPLGVNPILYRPGEKRALPPATLITTNRKGVRESPKGFLFINTSNPSFRKGIDVVIRSFEDAFSEDPDAALVLCVSYSSLVHCDPFVLVRGGRDACKSRIYVLEGKTDEYGMADMYRACNVYVTASRGEGWNLPLMEAAACGLPVIAPNAFSHKEFLTEENSFLFDPDLLVKIPDAEKISPWYQDQLFVGYHEKAIRTLSDWMRTSKDNLSLSKRKAELLRATILEKYTWDIVVGHMVTRLIEL